LTKIEAICTVFPYILMEGKVMSTPVTTYTKARANFAKLCDQAASTREPIIIRRRGAEPVALVAADELAGIMETAHLLRSPKNAERLLAALARVGSEKLMPSTVEDLRQELGLEKT
jgi:antitoxin YefM